MQGNNILLSLVTDENDYQRAQAESAITAARNFGLSVDLQYAQNDAVLQVQQILRALQDRRRRCDAIIAEPVGTAMDQAARIAAEAGIVWGILNRETGYTAAMRKISGRATHFEVTNDHVEIGRIQALQLAAMLPNGGTALYLEGPAGSGAARQRTQGMMDAKPANIELKTLKGDWTQGSATRTLSNWLSLGTSRKLGILAILCQNDAMALGVRSAIEHTLSGFEREQWMSLPITGCDGLPGGGQELVRRHILAATVIVPPNASIAIEYAARSMRGEIVPELTRCPITSCPSIESLRGRLIS